MRTFESEIKLSGVGIHSGAPVNVIIKPSKTPGIFFKRTDLKNAELLAAKYDNVGDVSLRNTTIGDVNGNHVQTIEHLMAALFVTGVDSAIIEIDGPETPILDGSAFEFCEIFKDKKTIGSGIDKIIVKKEIVIKKSDVLKTLPVHKKMMVLIHDWLMGRRNNGYIKLTPDDTGLVIHTVMDYPDKIIGRQEFDFIWDGSINSKKTFMNEIARARTFGRYSEWEYLKSRGMARGASEHNVIALNDKGDGTLNKLNWDNEFVRHNIVDLIGDMFTSGGQIVGRVDMYKGGHAMNNMVLKKLFSDPKNFDIIKG